MLWLWVIAVLPLAWARPHIVLIIADDLGWNDVGFHGLNNIPTPNIDALAMSGIVLQRHYVNPICTPSRSALMTGKYPIHTGMQHKVIYLTEPRGLPLSEKILPQYLKELGYSTHLVGKWHLGHFKKDYLPLNRGFDSHVGFWTGKIDMYDHIHQYEGAWGYDFRRGFEVAYDWLGKYATDIYTQESLKIIKTHNVSEPLFLTIAHSAVHSGNSYEPIRAPDDVIDKFKHINNTQRRKFAGVLSKLDESVGAVVKSLQSAGMLSNSVILFTTDNGGVPEGFNENAGSNYPLRGTKNTLWEGGVRGSALLWSPLLQKRSRVHTENIHLVDWLPTLFGIAGGDVSSLKDIDGVDQWQSLSKNEKSKRTTIVHNIDDEIGDSAITMDKWKLVNGTNYNGKWDKWYGPDGRECAYELSLLLSSPAGQAIHELGLMPSTNKILEVREASRVDCGQNTPIVCNPLLAPCLFNIEEDPCELRNLANLEPTILKKLLLELQKINSTVVPPNNQPMDKQGDPQYWGHVVTNFRDYQNTQNGNCF